MGKSYAERVLDEEADEAWRELVDKIAGRDIEMTRLETLRETDFDEYVRSGGADRLLELPRN